MKPWRIDAMDLAAEYGLTDQQAADLVILHWLELGDTKPFYDFVLSGHQPHALILKAICYMMMRGDPDCTVSNETAETDLWKAMPYALVVHGKNRGPRPKAWIMTRDRLLAREVEKQMKAGVSYDGAIATVREFFEREAARVDPKTVRDAYDYREK